jgi:hypothetical protein
MHYHPDEEMDDPAVRVRADRIDATNMLIGQRNAASEELDEEIWNLDTAANTQQTSNQSTRRRPRSQSFQRRNDESRPRTRITTAAARRPMMERQIVTIQFRNQFGVEHVYRVTKATSISKVFELYSERVCNGLNISKLSFFN